MITGPDGLATPAMLDELFGLPPKRILLIEPPFYSFFGYERWHYPITLVLLGTLLEERGHLVRIYDGDRPAPGSHPLTRTEVGRNYHLYGEALRTPEHSVWSRVNDAIRDFDPDVVGLTSITAKIDSANLIARMSKSLLGDRVRVILGGAHAQGMRQMYPDYDFGPDYDCIVTHIPNLVDRTPNKNLLLDREGYPAKSFMTLMTSTGCPNACTFCCNSYERRVHYRSLRSIDEEISRLAEFSQNDAVYILDDCVFSNRRRFKELADLIHEHGYGFSAGARIMALTEDTIDWFKSRGGRRVLVGVESGSQATLDRIRKRLSIAQIIRRTQWLREHQVVWSAFVMAGFPFETLDDLKMTEDLVYKIQPNFVSLNKFTPYPGTQLWKECFFDTPIDFKDLYQLNIGNQVVRLSVPMERYIEEMFTRFDDYNRARETTVAVCAAPRRR